MRVYALIPARAGSKGIPNKNIRPIAGHPLLAYTIPFARKFAFDRVIVSTDSAQYRDIAVRYGGECPYLRGPDASSDTAMEEDILTDLAGNLPALGIPMPDIWVRLKPTSPFRTVKSVNNAIALLNNDDIDSVRIVSETEGRLHIINADGFLQPMSPDWDPKRSVMRRSEFPATYRPFNLDVFRHAGWLARGSNYMGHRIRPIIENKITGIDIDDESDFDLAAALISLRPRPAFLTDFIHDPS